MFVDKPKATFELEPQAESHFQALACVWIQEDDIRLSALKLVQACALVHAMPQWCIAAGFVRNLVWDRLHGLTPQALNDIDVIYYCPLDISPERDLAIERYLLTLAPELPWSVKNQARMHLHNQDSPYHNISDAMAHWPEIETAVAVTLSSTLMTHSHSENAQANDAKLGEHPANDMLDMALNIIAPFGLTSLFSLKITPNPRRKRAIFQTRVTTKNWLATYPKLTIGSLEVRLNKCFT